MMKLINKYYQLRTAQNGDGLIFISDLYSRRCGLTALSMSNPYIYDTGGMVRKKMKSSEYAQHKKCNIMI